jgi:hypothetical protein
VRGRLKGGGNRSRALSHGVEILSPRSSDEGDEDGNEEDEDNDDDDDDDQDAASDDGSGMADMPAGDGGAPQFASRTAKLRSVASPFHTFGTRGARGRLTGRW